MPTVSLQLQGSSHGSAAAWWHLSAREELKQVWGWQEPHCRGATECSRNPSQPEKNTLLYTNPLAGGSPDAL